MIPKTPLTLNNFDPSKITLDEYVLFLGGSHSSVPQKVKAIHSFLITKSTWTAEEVGAIELGELVDIGTQLRAKVDELAVPKGKSKSSRTGHDSRKRAAKQQAPLSGQIT